jgi:ubiquinone/menaquinone biosynthesis C-methylase UbiE
MVPSLLNRLLLACALAAGTSCAHHAANPEHSHAHGMPHRFEGAEQWAHQFDAPERDDWQKPDEVVAALALPPGAKVADIGAGTGYFAVRLARAVPQGRVYGVDIEPDMVRYLRERAAREGLPHLEAVLGRPEDPLLPEPVDLALIVNTWHHIEQRPVWLERLKSQLNPGGRIAIVDFRPESRRGPPPQHKLSAGQVSAELQAAGFRLVAEHDFLPEQYFLVFQRAVVVRAMDSSLSRGD